MKDNLNSFMKTGQNIEIETQKDVSSSIRLKSNVVKVISSDTLVILSPIKDSKIYPIHVGNIINIIFYINNTGKYYFQGEVIKRESKNKLSFLYIKQIDNMQKMQRRNFFRLNIVLNIDIEVIENNNVIKELQCLTKDISGGGIRFISKEKLPSATLINCKIPIDDEIVEISGKVIRSKKIPDSIISYDIAINFENIEEDIRSKVIKFIFDKQRKILKKGLS